MITVDFISPGGAFTPAAKGDTQDTTTTFTISIGSPTLTCNGASPFVAGDTGKYFMIRGAGSSGESSQWLFGTMTYVSANQVTLSVNATKALTATSARLVWGTDDAPAARAFNTWAQAQTDSITLTLGSGAKSFIFASSDSNAQRGGGLCYNVSFPISVVGNGGSTGTTKFIYTTVFQAFCFVCSTHLKTGTGTYPGILNNGLAYLNSVSAGATSIQCKTASDATGLFTAGKWALISGLDLMGTGSPPNPFLYEYVLPTNVNGTTGGITLQDPLQNSYSDTWPVFNVGDANHDNHGGPASLYAINDGWGVEATFQGILLDLIATGGQTYSKGRKMTFQDVKLVDGNGLIPSGSKEVIFNSCVLNTYQMEVDKITERVTFDNTVTGQLFFQSSVDIVTVQNGSNISGGLNGTPRNLTVTGSTVAGVNLGATAFGRTDSFISSGSTFTSTFTLGGVSDSGDNTGALRTDYTMSNTGLLTMPRSGRAYAGLRWALPGTRAYFSGGETSAPFRAVRWGPGFTVLSVTADATNIYVQTDWPYTGGIPSWASFILVTPSKYLSLASDTSSSVTDVQRLMAANAAGYSIPGTYMSLTLNGGNCGTSAFNFSATPLTAGKLVSLTLNVTTPYTGSSGTLTWSPGATQYVITNGGTITSWIPIFDLKTPGARIIRPGGVTGTAGADSGLALPDPNAWHSRWFNGLGTPGKDITAEYAGNNAVGPVFTVEAIYDQGFVPAAVAPLRLRLRAP